MRGYILPSLLEVKDRNAFPGEPQRASSFGVRWGWDRGRGAVGSRTGVRWGWGRGEVGEGQG